MLYNKKISLITTCMGRADHLDQTLPTWLLHPIDEIVVVDWSSPDNVKEVINKYQDGRIVYVKVPNQTVFSRSKSRNTGVRLSTGYFLIMCEVDIKFGEQALSCIKGIQNILYNNRSGPGLCGVCILTRQMFQQINGYNERFEGWGFEDYDLFERVEKYYGVQKTLIDINHIDHSDGRRSMFHTNKNIFVSEGRNRLSAQRSPWTKNNMQQKMIATITKLGRTYGGII